MTARRTGIASVAALAALSATMGSAHLLAPEWVRQAGVDVWNLSSAETELRQNDEYGRQLTSDGDVLFRQIDASERVVNDLAAGRVSLPDAVAELERVNAGRPGFHHTHEIAYPDAADGRERLARHAIDKARLLGDTTRLEAEYRAMTAKSWTPAR